MKHIERLPRAQAPSCPLDPRRSLHVIPVRIAQIFQSIILAVADAENHFPIDVSKGLPVQSSPRSWRRSRGLLEELGRTGICALRRHSERFAPAGAN
jgi:hypothetical protein